MTTRLTTIVAATLAIVALAVPAALLSGSAGAASSSGYRPVVPGRLADSRVGGGTVDGLFAGEGVVGAGGVRVIQVAGRGGVGVSAGAAVVNVTAVGPLGDGYLTMWPCDVARPNVSNVNYRAGVDVANTVVTKLAADGTVCVFSFAATDVIVDVQGSYPGGPLPVSNITLAEYSALVDQRRIDKDSPDDAYVEPTDSERDAYYDALRALLHGDLDTAAIEFGSVGYGLRYLTNAGDPLIAFEELGLDQSGTYRRGWGGGVLPVTAIGGVPLIGKDAKSVAYVMTPHTIHDTRTGIVGHLMFDRLLDDAAFSATFHTVHFWNTAYRYNSTTDSSQGSKSTIADCARDDGNMCREMTRALADHTHAMGEDIVYMVLHGYKLDDDHQDAIDHFGPDDQADDIVLGPDDLTSMHLALRDELVANGFANTKLCGDDWPVDLGLCGTTDEVYRNLLSSGDVAFHAEIETHHRAVADVASTAVDLTTALRNTMIAEMS